MARLSRAIMQLRPITLSKHIILLSVVLVSVTLFFIYSNDVFASYGPVPEPSLKSALASPSSHNLTEAPMKSAPLLTNNNAHECVILSPKATIKITPGVTSPAAQIARVSGYSPDCAEVNVGSTVTWVNQDRVAHTVSSEDKNHKPTNNFDSGNIDPGGNWSNTFGQKGVYYYYDKLNSYLEGTINVNTTSPN